MAFPGQKVKTLQALTPGVGITVTEVLDDDDFIAYLKTPRPRGKNFPYTLDQSAVPVSIIQCNTGITWALAADPGNGKTRILASGAHGFTTSPAVGKSIYITGWSGTGIAGFYNIATVVDGFNLDIDLAYAAGLGNPVVVQANTEVTLASITIQGGAMGANGSVQPTARFSTVNSANTKTFKVRLGGVSAWTASQTAIAGFQIQSQIWNKGAANLQDIWNYPTNAFGGSTVAPTTMGVDTVPQQSLAFTAQPATANEYIELRAYTTVIFPGA